jgi:hypothetical protein
MPSDRHALVERRATYITLSGIFLSLVGAFALQQRREDQGLDVRPFDLVMLGFATYRLGRLTSYDKVAETFRAPFTETRPDESGAGKTVVPKGQGMRQALGELIACPICSGTWIAAGLVYGLHAAPVPTRTFLTIMSSIGIAELLNAATEALQWTGQFAREETGEHLRKDS